VAVGRDVTKVADLSRRGVTVRRAHYDDPASLRAALADTDTLLFVSGSEVGRRIAQHQAVIAAAVEADVSLVAYTSAPKADTSDMMLVEDHRATERALVASGLRLGPALCLLLAAEISRASSRQISYTDLSEEAYARMFMAAGVPQPMAVALADTHRAAAQGALYIEGNDSPRLLGRPATSVAQVIRAALNLTFSAVVRLTCANDPTVANYSCPFRRTVPVRRLARMTALENASEVTDGSEQVWIHAPGTTDLRFRSSELDGRRHLFTEEFELMGFVGYRP
jgi:NAD(P)H-binding